MSENKLIELQVKVEDADRQRSILQTNLDAETTRGNVLDRENERLQAKVEELEDSVDRCSSRNVADADLIADLQAKVDEAQFAEHEADHDRQKAWDHTDELQAKVEELTKPVPPAEEGEFTSCAEMLDDWFNSCNVQGTAQMETVEVEELTEEMRRIEKRHAQEVEELISENQGLRCLIDDEILELFDSKDDPNEAALKQEDE